ncbi:MAG: hypothetical protein JWQ88_1129, partial [Rhodoferax sp.]|nr:hypothetical protein [Rhodoferax sp.]
MKIFSRDCVSSLALAIALASGLPARAATLEGVTFDDTARVGGSQLHLNGLGLRAV